MIIKRYFILLVLIFSTLFSVAQVEKPVLWSVESEKIDDQTVKIFLKANIEDGWYIYDLFSYENGPNSTVLNLELPFGLVEDGSAEVVGGSKVTFDSVWGMDIGKLNDGAVIEQTLKFEKGGDYTINGTVEWQSCSDTSCLPPEEYQFTLDVSGSMSGGLSNVMWGVIIEAILWGFAALLTPCVFPMVFMTISLFLKQHKSRARGKIDAIIYGLSIILLYTLPIAILIATTYFLGGDSVTANIFNFLATHYIPNIIFFVIFVLFAASFFGAFEIVLPSWIVNKSDRESDKGGILGIFFMALTLVLASFSCTGPIVGSILVKSTQGEIWEPIITMLAFSTAFALPFTLFALFPSLLKSIPKSGGWLGSVKIVLGFIELALALKFLSVADQTYHWGILSRELYLSIWIAIFTLLALYFLGKLRFAHDEAREFISVRRLFLAIITFSFVVYLFSGLFGASLKPIAGYLPPQRNVAIVDNRVEESGVMAKYSDFLQLPGGLSGFFDYDEGMEYAASVGKPVLLDFTGHGCVNCREMEAVVWADPKVLSILRNNYVVIALYTDDRKRVEEGDERVAKSGKILKTIGSINAQFQIDRFGVNALPYYVLLDNSGKELVSPRGYDLSVEKFISFLNKGIERYNNVNK